MKWLSLALFASAALASPVVRRDDDLTVYTLKVSSGSAGPDGSYLACNGSTVGVFHTQQPVQVYTVPSGTGQKGLYELHTYPIGIVDHALGLVGNGGLLQLTDVAQPASTTFPVGTTCDWTSFSLGGSRDPDIKGDTLQYNGARGKWVAFPGAGGSWKVTWLTGSAIVIQDYIPIEVELVKVDE